MAEEPLSEEVLELPQGILRRTGRLIEYIPDAGAKPPDPEQLVEQRNAVRERLLEARSKLDPLLDSTNPLELLMQLAIPYAVFDPNDFRESEMERLPVFVEFLALQILPRLPVGDASWDPRDMGQILTEVEDLIEEIFHLRLLDYQLTIATEEGLRPIERTLRYEALSRSTLIRFPAYTQHTIETFRGLYSPFASELKSSLGFDLEEGIALANQIPQLTVEPALERAGSYKEEVEKLRKEVKRARRGKGADDEMIGALAELPPSDAVKVIQGIATSWTFANSRELGAVTPDRLAAAAAVSEEVAEAFLKAMTVDPSSYDVKFHLLPPPTHPMQERPAIRDEEGWLFPVPLNTLFALPAVLEEGLYSAGAIDSYQEHRGRYLETEATGLLGKALEPSSTWTRLNWRSTTADAQGEVDGLVGYGGSGLRLQCKAGQLTPPAKRGGLLRVTSDLKKLVGDAVGQHRELRHALQRESAEEIGLIEVADIVVGPLQLEIVVTLDDINPFGHEIFKMVDFGTIAEDESLPWVVSLNDLRIITAILDRSQLVHYLMRRARLNRVGRIYAPDEIDWLGHYLTEGLYFDEWLRTQDDLDFVALSSYTDDIDAWFLFEHGSRDDPVPKPCQPIPPGMGYVIRQLEQQRPEGFLVCTLLMLEWAWDTRELFSRSYLEAGYRAVANGAADFSMMFFDARYGLTYSTGRTHAHVISEDEARSYAAEKKSQHEVPLWVVILQDEFRFRIMIESDDLEKDLEFSLIEPRLEALGQDPEIQE